MRHSAVLARAPSAAGKTRLTAGLSEARARALRSALLADTLQAVTAAGEPCTVFVTPPEAMPEVVSLAGPGVAVWPQEAGDLGQRMAAAFDRMWAAGASHVVLVGSDLPSLPASRVTDAFGVLSAGAEVVLGPAEDGGYYLIGLTRPEPRLFEGMAWGGPDVLRCTLEAAAAARLRAALVDGWYDVDVPGDLERVIDSPAPAAAVRAWFAGG